MRGDRLRRPYRQEHRHATADGVHVVGDVAAEDDVCWFFEGDIRILRKMLPQAMRSTKGISA